MEGGLGPQAAVRSDDDGTADQVENYFIDSEKEYATDPNVFGMMASFPRRVARATEPV